MEFPYLTADQRDMRMLAKSYMLSEQVRTWISDAQKTKKFPAAFVRDITKHGFMSMNIEDRFGGMGMSYLDAVVVFEELAYASIPFSLIILVQNSLAAFPIQHFGTETQKQKYLPHMSSGELLGCFANTEPDAGSDAKNIITRAVKKGNKWTLHGRKHFCTSASEAGVAIVFARTSRRKAGHPGTSAFLVDLAPEKPKGFECRIQDKVAQHGSTLCELVFDGVEVPEENILGEVDKGWDVCDRTFLHSRLWIAMQGVGAARRAFDETARYTSTREAFGAPLIKKQALAFELARIQTAIRSGYLHTHSALTQEMNDPTSLDFLAMAAMAKYVGTEAGEQAALKYWRFCGGISIMSEFGSAQHLLDSLVPPIYEGPNEVQLQIIANNIIRSQYIAEYDRTLQKPELS